MKRRADGRYLKIITVNGKKLYFYSRETTEKAAEKDIQAQLLRYREKEECGRLFKEIANEWSEIKRNELAPMVWEKSYNASFDRIVKHFNGEYIKSITARDIDYFIKGLAFKRYSQKTVTTHKNIFNMIFNYAFINGDISINPVPSIKVPSGLPKAERLMPKDSEIEIIRTHYKGNDFLAYFLLYTGLRISEAMAITDKDIDLKNKLISVNKKVIWQTNAPEIIHKTKTKAGTRTVPLLDKLACRLPKFKGYLFSTDGGKTPYTRKELRYRWSHYQKEYGLTVTAHQLRHGFCTMAFEAGLEPKELQEIIGHADINTTMNIYTELRQKQKDKVREKLNNYDF